MLDRRTFIRAAAAAAIAASTEESMSQIETQPSGSSTTEDLPAIAGGKPVRSKPLTRAARYGDEELQQLREAIDQGTLFYAQGKKVKALESAFAEAVGSKFAVACSSGTAAIHAAMIAAGVSPGDEVIVTPITDMGSIVPILYQGAVPIFADLDPHTYNLDPKAVEKSITPKTRAILAVHLAGNSCDMDALRALCDDRKIVLIEDCAQAHGTRYRGKHVGTIGSMGCFSFNEFKHISSGDGGIVTSDDPKLAERMRLATDKCYNRKPGVTSRQAIFLANNYRMTELQGAVALAQLAKLPSIVERRQKWCASLSEQIKGLPGIHLPKVTDGCEPTWWFYMIRVDEKALGVSTDEFTRAMGAEGIPMGAHYIGDCVYEYPLFVDHSAFEHNREEFPHPYTRYTYNTGLCPVAEEILDTCAMISCNEGFTDEDLADAVKAFTRVTRHFAAKVG